MMFVIFFTAIAVFAVVTIISIRNEREKCFQYAVCMLKHNLSGKRVYEYLVDKLGEDDAELIYKRACRMIR